MHRSSQDTAAQRKASDMKVSDLIASHAAGEDPRRTMARLNATIVDCQRAGLDMPRGFVDLSRRLSAACVARDRRRPH